MSDGQLDSKRNRYNIAGVQVANPQAKGDIAVGSNNTDPTGRTISQRLSLPSQDGYVLTSDSSDTTFGLKWSAPIAQVNDTPNKLAGFADPSGEIEAKENLTHHNNGLTIGAQTNQGKSSITLESQAGSSTNDHTKLVIQSSNLTDSDQTRHDITIDNGAISQNRHDRLTFNSRIGLQAQTSHGRYNNSVVNLTVKAHTSLVADDFPSRYALAQFATGNGSTSPSVNAKMITLPANSLNQLNALPALLKQEYKDVESSLSQDGKVLDTLHSQASTVEHLAENGIAYCMEDDSYYVYSQVEDKFLKLTTASDVSAIGAMTVKESSSESVQLTGGLAEDVEYTSMFSFGQILKIEATGSSTMTASTSVRLEFYKSSGMSNADFTGQAEIVVQPNATTYAYPSVTVEDSASLGIIYVKIQNISTNNILDATIKIKGAGI